MALPLEAGQRILAADLNLATQKGLYRGERLSSSSTTTTTEIGVLRLTGIPLLGGHGYWIRTSSLIYDSSVNGDAVTARIRHTTDGSTPTTSSALIAGGLEHVSSSSGQSVAPIARYYVPSADQTLGLILCVVRVAGTGTVGLLSATGFPIDLVVDYDGLAPADTGVDL